MTQPHFGPAPPSHRRRTPALLRKAAAGLIVGASVAAASDENAAPLPRAGMWELKTTQQSQAAPARSSSDKQCVDPMAHLRRTAERLLEQGCKVSGLKKRGNTYSFASECRLDGRLRLTYSVMNVDDDDTYTLDVVSHGSEGLVKEHLEAKRLGEC